MVVPSAPAVGWVVIFTEARLVSVIQGAVPVKVYVNVELVAPTEEVNVPAAALNVPPVPDVRVQTPPACSAVIKLNRLTAVVLVSQTFVPPSAPAFG